MFCAYLRAILSLDFLKKCSFWASLEKTKRDKRGKSWWSTWGDVSSVWCCTCWCSRNNSWRERVQANINIYVILVLFDASWHFADTDWISLSLLQKCRNGRWGYMTLSSFLPLLRECIPDAAAELESEIDNHIFKSGNIKLCKVL